MYKAKFPWQFTSAAPVESLTNGADIVARTPAPFSKSSCQSSNSGFRSEHLINVVKCGRNKRKRYGVEKNNGKNLVSCGNTLILGRLYKSKTDQYDHIVIDQRRGACS